MYALNLDPVSNRILSATYPQYASADSVIVNILPDGDISDYLYVNEEYVYDPLPDPEPVPDPEDRISILEADRDAVVEALLIAFGGENYERNN